MQELDDEFPRLTKLREARAARLARQCATNKRPPAVERSPTSVAAAFDVTTTFVQDKYDDVCRRVSHIDRDIEDLLTRGTYLAQQTVLDAEAHHKSAYGLHLGEVDEFKCDTLNFEKDDQTNSKRAIKTHQPRQPGLVGEMSLNISNPAKNLSPLFHRQKDYCTIRVTELLLKRKSETIRRHFFSWKSTCIFRRALRVRLRQSKGPTSQDVLDSIWLGVHHDVGKESYHPEEIFKRDGKFRMAKVYQENRIKRLTFGRWMMGTCLWLERKDGKQQNTPKGAIRVLHNA